MNETARKRTPRYSHNISRVWLNVATAVLSIILTLILLRENPFFLLYYIILTSVLAMITFVLKIRLANIRSATPQESSFQNEESAPKKGSLVLLFFMLFAVLASPFLLAGFLPPHVWFILIVGLATGISISEIIFYIYCEKIVSQNA